MSKLLSTAAPSGGALGTMGAAAYQRSQATRSHGAFLMDADFSPVTRVNFHVEPLAPPSDSQERLILEVWTTGSVTPATAVADAASLL